MNFNEYFTMKNKDLIYFDNAATSFKPINVINKEIEYLTSYTSNSSRGDYNIGFKVNDEIDKTRYLVSKFINARDKSEIIFTKNTTDSLNLIVFGFFKYYLKEKDEIILNKAEHASNILPWIKLAKEKNLVIKYASLGKDNKLNVDSIKKCITSKTKVISLACITNTIGDLRDINEITKTAHESDILVVVDGAQSVGHIKTDVQKSNVDFLAFSAHKMLGDTGLGIMYAKKCFLYMMEPISYGGGMNLDYNESDIEYLGIPNRFESGTLNISSIIGFSESIKFLNNVGFDYIEKKEKYLRKYLIEKLKKIPYVKILNEFSESGIVLINIDNILSGDLGLFLNKYNICVRSGKHCTKMLKDESDFVDSVRISLYFYNDFDEIDYLIDVLSKYDEIMDYAN